LPVRKKRWIRPRERLAPFPHIALVDLRLQTHGLFKPELQHCLGRDTDFISLRQHLSSGARGSSNGASDCRTRTTAGDCTDERTERCAAAHHFGSPFICAQPSLLIDIIRGNDVLDTVYGDRFQADFKTRSAADTA
jgi:hypothetical protein